MIVRTCAAEDGSEYGVLCSESLDFFGYFDLAQPIREIKIALDLSFVRDHFKEVIEILISDLVEHFKLLFLCVRNESAQFDFLL